MANTQTASQNKKPQNPALIRFTLLPLERDWLRDKAAEVDMSVVAYIKSKIVGSHYDPNVRNILLRLNHDLTLYGHSLTYISASFKQGTLPQNRSEALLRDIRIPLIETLQALKRFLAQGMIFP